MTKVKLSNGLILVYEGKARNPGRECCRTPFGGKAKVENAVDGYAFGPESSRLVKAWKIANNVKTLNDGHVLLIAAEFSQLHTATCVAGLKAAGAKIGNAASFGATDAMVEHYRKLQNGSGTTIADRIANAKAEIVRLSKLEAVEKRINAKQDS